MSSSDKIKGWEETASQIADWKNEGLTVVFTNGCFDLIHLGHVDYLEKARQLGDKLVVGLNSDDSIRRIKGSDRPVTDIDSRARVLAAMGFIDGVVVFDQDTPLELIQMLLPDILVKGDDYLAENVVGADIVTDNGGKVLTVPLVKGYSTSGIINKIRQ